MILLLLACSQNELANVDVGTIPQVVSSNVDPYQLVVWPARSTESDGSVRAYPVRIPAIQLDVATDVDLRRPVQIQGSVVGLNATPAARARLPGSVGAVDATLAFHADDSLEDLVVRTDAEGDFVAWLTPGTHDVLVRPESGLVPPLQFAFEVAEGVAPLDLDLREFVPVWGRVTQAGQPKRDSAVRLGFDDGSVGPTVFTDTDGWYELRATEGLSVSLVSSGSGNRVDPTLVSTPTVVGPQGLRYDFEYSAEPVHTLSARIVGDADTPLSGLPFRLVSTSLSAYEDGVIEVTGFTDTVGNITTRGLAGSYELTILLEQASKRTALSLELTLEDTLDLGDLRLQPLIGLDGDVRDVNGKPLAGTVVDCTEVGFSGRSWSTTTDVDGEYSLDVPRSTISCSAAPGDRTDLAAVRVDIDPTQTNPLLFELGAGRRVFGRVDFEGQAEEYALVEVTDARGLVWATALTDGRGEFELRIQPAE